MGKKRGGNGERRKKGMREECNEMKQYLVKVMVVNFLNKSITIMIRSIYF